MLANLKESITELSKTFLEEITIKFCIVFGVRIHISMNTSPVYWGNSGILANFPAPNINALFALYEEGSIDESPAFYTWLLYPE